MTITEQLEQLRRDREDTRLATSTHEIGHVVAAHTLGGRVDYVTLVPRGNRAGGTCYVRPPDPWDQLVVDLAGGAAAEAFGWSGLGCGSDERYARIQAVTIAGRDWFDHDRLEAILAEGRARSAALVRRHWRPILGLSQLLARRLRLAGTELDSALNAAIRPSPSQRAADREWNEEFFAALANLNAEHRRRDPFQRLLGATPNSKAGGSSPRRPVPRVPSGRTIFRPEGPSYSDIAPN